MWHTTFLPILFNGLYERLGQFQRFDEIDFGGINGLMLRSCVCVQSATGEDGTCCLKFL